ncbi:hypothetical protein BJY52DRAFT_1413429 [Lactarius psammicola]|nr:hypothetical protein BJY52DRAFT_1413429 [Lactarius psammicola]
MVRTRTTVVTPSDNVTVVAPRLSLHALASGGSVITLVLGCAHAHHRLPNLSSAILQHSSNMNQPPASSSMSASANFKVIFEKALKAYQKTTKQDLTAHPLASQLQACDSPAAILTILQGQVDQFIQSRSGDERLKKWLNPTISVLYAFSAIRQVFSPAKAIFAGAGVLLLAAKDVEASQDVLIDVFERIENFFRRLENYTDVPPTPAMTDIMAKIMVEVLDILGTATKEMKQSRANKTISRLRLLEAHV